MFFIILFSNIAGVVALAYWFVKQRFQYWKRLGVPYIEPDSFYGNGKGLDTTKHRSNLFMKGYSMFKSMASLFGLYFSIRQIAVATDLNLIKNILVKDSANFLNRGMYFNEKDDPLSAHLIHLEDEEWEFLRNKIIPTFTSEKIKAMYSTVFGITDRLVKKIKFSRNVDIKEIFGRFTTDVIGSCAFGIECNSLEEEISQFHEGGKSIFKSTGFFKNQFCTTFPNFAKGLGLKLYPKCLTDFYFDVVSKTVKHRDANPTEERKEKQKKFIETQFKSYLGFETTATSLTYCTYELSKNKNIQRKARESVYEAMAKHGNVLTYECVNDMKYLEQCVNESMRIHPVLHSLSRQVKEDYPVPNSSIVLEKGLLVIIPVLAIQRDPDIYTDPLKFDPDRFTPEEMNKRNPLTFLPFGEGPRICVGKRFAYVEMKLALAQLLMNFEFSLDFSKITGPTEINIRAPFTLVPRDGVFLSFKQRNICE